jgi:hypothetical protein
MAGWGGSSCGYCMVDITLGAVTLNQTATFTDFAQFFAHSSLSTTALVAGLFEDLPIPPDVTGIQLDLTTGQLVKRINSQLVILL